MSRPSESIHPDRLILAAEAALRAVEEIAEHTRGVRPYPPDLMGSALQPECLVEFTKFEIAEASAFLVRMGLIERPATRRAV